MMSFNVLETFISRTPMLSYDAYERYIEGKDSEQLEKILEELSDSRKLQEILMVSSENLSKSIMSKDCKKINDKTIKSVFRYITRMSTRTVPFGLMAGIETGVIGADTRIIEKKDEITKIARPCFGWILKVIEVIERDDTIREKIPFKINRSIVKNGIKIKINNITDYGRLFDSKGDMITTINYTDQVERVMEITEDYTPFGDIVNILIDENEGVPKEIIVNFIEELIDNEFLLSKLRPPMLNTDQMMYLIDRLEEYDSNYIIYQQLKDMYFRIRDYEKSNVGDGIELYEEILQNMRDICDDNCSLQVDMKMNSSDIQIGQTVVNEIKKVMDMLKKIVDVNPYPWYLQEYADAFNDKYGSNTEVAVVELMDNCIGLGAPADYLNPTSTRDASRYRSKVDPVLDKLIYAKFSSGQVIDNEIIITEEDVAELSFNKKIKNEELMKTYDISVFLGANSCEDINNGDFKMALSPINPTGYGGKMAGRFTHLIQEDLNLINDINEAQENIECDDTILATISEIPTRGLLGNVMVNHNFRKYEVLINTNGTSSKNGIDVDDIYIGLDNDMKFYIKSRSLNRRIKVFSDNMLNISLATNIFRFLVEVSTGHKTNIMSSICRSRFEDMDFIPRIRYGRTTIRPATWNISGKKFLRGMKESEFIAKFNNWRNKYGCPRCVYVTESDNRLMIDLDNTYHMNIVYESLKKGKVLCFTELEISPEELWVKKDGKKFYSEMIFTLIDEEEQSVKKRKDIEACKYHDTQVQGVEDGWIYFKFYGIEDRLDEFLGEHLREFSFSLKRNGLVEKFFFIKYADPEEHVRFRLKTSKEETYRVLESVYRWIEEMREIGIISRYVSEPYIRETNRYGGKELIEYAEDVFFGNSVFVMNLKKAIEDGIITENLEVLIPASIIFIMENMNISYEEQRDWFLSKFEKEYLRKEFKANRNKYIKLCNSSREWESMRDTQEGRIFFDMLKVMERSIKVFSEKLEEKKFTVSQKMDITMSIIHMNCNRFSIDKNKERDMMSYTRHALQSLDYFKRGGDHER